MVFDLQNGRPIHRVVGAVQKVLLGYFLALRMEERKGFLLVATFQAD
jgi:hypothetical protein